MKNTASHSSQASERGTNDSDWSPDRIRGLRERLGLSQREMGKLLGKWQQGVSEWERGVGKPRRSSAKLLSLIAREAEFTD